MLNLNNKKNRKDSNTRKALKLFCYTVVIILSTTLVLGFLILNGAWQSAFASVFGFTQTDWSGGASTTALAVHPGDQSGWTYYNTASSSISAGTELTLISSAGSSLQTTDTDFNAGSFSTTTVSGVGVDAKIILKGTQVAPQNNSFETGDFSYWTADANWGIDNDTNVTGYDGIYTAFSSDYVAGVIKSNTALNLPANTYYLKVRVRANRNDGSAADNYIRLVRTSDLTILASYSYAYNDNNYHEVVEDISSLAGEQVRFEAEDAKTTGYGQFGIDFVRITDINGNNIYEYPSSGTFTSSVADLGQTAAFTTLNYTVSTSASTTITIDIRAGNTAVPDGTWTAWQTNISNGGDISALDGNRYVQYRSNLSTIDSALTPFLNDVTINYQSYPASQTLISSPYDTSDNVTAISQISWTENLPAGTDIKFQIRTAPDSSGPWTDWLGPSGTSDYYTDPSGGETINPTQSDGVNDRWIQYKAFLSGGLYTPTLSDVSLSYTITTPAVSATDSVTVTQSVITGISINSPADVTMNNLSITQNTSVGTTTWKVITNNQSGYTLAVKASASSAMSDSSTGESFADYGTSSPATWNVSNAYQFGFAPLGNDTVGYGTGTLCESSNYVPSATLAYTGFYTANRTIASSSSETSVGGTETTVCYAAGQETKLAPSGAYTAVITATATTQ